MILNLFKSKPTLKEVIPEGFIDIHSHILPGIDDGPKNIDESLKLISEIKNLGFKKIYATPHTYHGVHNNTSETILNSYKSLMKKLDLDISVSYSSEYLLDNSLIKKAEEKSLLTIKNKYVLVEMSYINKPINLHEIIFQLKLNDYIPILAHPERYRFLFNNFKDFYLLKKIGCEFQLNLLSTTGYYGNDIVKISERLLNENLINFVGSDIHNLRHTKHFDETIKIKKTDKLAEVIANNEFFSE